MVKPWQEYQHRTAELLHQLGLEAKADDPIRAPNGIVHHVDVSASGSEPFADSCHLS